MPAFVLVFFVDLCYQVVVNFVGFFGFDGSLVGAEVYDERILG